VVLHDEIRFAFFDGPGRWEAAGCHSGQIVTAFALR
jgi:hypothetical protein